MLRNSVITAIFMVICLFAVIQAQPEKGWGIGVTIVDIQQLFEFSSAEARAFNSSIQVPFVLSPSFRLEPEIGYFRGKEVDELNTYKDEYTATQWRIGIGIFPQSMLKSSTIYYGARVGYVSLNLKEEETIQGITTTDEATASGFFVAPALGGEYFFSNSFSLGAEGQLFYANLSTDIEGAQVDITTSLINTRGLVFVRFYF
jgi:hypothetical protein